MCHSLKATDRLQEFWFVYWYFLSFLLFIQIRVISLETSTFEELGSEFINFACNCVINTLRLIVYLTGFSI